MFRSSREPTMYLMHGFPTNPEYRKVPIQATSTASVVLSVTSKSLVFRSLAKFLRASLARADPSSSPPSSTSLPTWYFESSFVNHDVFATFDHIFLSSTVGPRIWEPQIGPDDNDDDLFVAELTTELVPPEPTYTLRELCDLDVEQPLVQADYETVGQSILLTYM